MPSYIKYMDRRWIVLPAITAVATAQIPAVSREEKALRARAEEFFRLQVEKKYREAEKLVAGDALNDYAGSSKPRLDGFQLQTVRFLNKTRAEVTIMAKTTVLMMGAGAQKFDVPSVSSWKLDHGKWSWYLDPELYSKTPFGTAKGKSGEDASPSQAFSGFPANAPSLADIQNGIRADRTELVLVPGGQPDKVTITNSLGGVARIKQVERSTPVPGLQVSPRTLEILPGAKAAVEFSAATGAAFEAYVDLAIEPLGRNMTIHVITKK